MRLLLGSCVILFVSFLTFLPSFNLALFGDDWLAFFRYAMHVAPKSEGEWINLSYFLTPYGAQDMLMGILRNFFGLESTPYFYVSFIFRMLAAFSLYPITYFLTKSKLASAFAVAFLAVTTTGLDTTNWVFNMPTYITIALFNLFLYFFLKEREGKSFKLLLLSALLYYLAYVVTPIRMHGSLPFIFLLEAFWVIRERNGQTLKRALIRIAVILGVFLIIRYTGHSQGPAQEVSERLYMGVQTMTLLLQQGRFDFIFHPLIILGGMIMPDFLIQQMAGLSEIGFTTFFLNILSWSIFLIISLLLISTSKDMKKSFFLKFLSISLLWTLIFWLVFPKNIEVFPNNIITPSVSLVLLNLGGYTLILLILLLIENWHKEKLSTALFISLIWPILSFFAAWWFTPQVIFPTTYRYLIVSVIGISIFFASLITLGKELKYKIILTATLSAFLILHLFSTNYYLRLMEGFRSQKITDKIWSSIPYIPQVGKEPLVVYFEGDSSNYLILYNTITFGFPPHMQILYNLTEKDFAPVPMTNWAEVVSAVKDGQSFKAYGYPLKPIPIDHVYGFYLQGKDNLINITDLARQKLVED